MKKSKNHIFKFIFIILFVFFLIIYFSEITGYYEYQNYDKKTFTQEQINEFESDVKEGKEIDINDYLVIEKTNYNNNLSKFASNVSDTICNIVESGIKESFKIIYKLVEE